MLQVVSTEVDSFDDREWDDTSLCAKPNLIDDFDTSAVTALSSRNYNIKKDGKLNC